MRVTKRETLDEIIFRAKDINTGDWIEGDVIKWVNWSEDRRFCTQHAMIIPNDSVKKTPENWKDIDPDTVSRFTGLLTADDREKVWEGDKVRMHQFNHEGGDVSPSLEGYLEYFSNSACWGIRVTKPTRSSDIDTGDWFPISCFYGLHEESWTIIGNIHDKIKEDTLVKVTVNMDKRELYSMVQCHIFTGIVWQIDEEHIWVKGPMLDISGKMYMSGPHRYLHDDISIEVLKDGE